MFLHNTDLKVSPGGLAATADVSGVVKVWRLGPSPYPTTAATFISASPVSCLAWVDDRRLLYGTHLGQVRLSDVEEKCLLPETSYASLAGYPISTVVTSPTGSTFFAATANAALIINTKTFGVERARALGGRPPASSLAGHSTSHVLF